MSAAALEDPQPRARYRVVESALYKLIRLRERLAHPRSQAITVSAERWAERCPNCKSHFHKTVLKHGAPRMGQQASDYEERCTSCHAPWPVHYIDALRPPAPQGQNAYRARALANELSLLASLEKCILKTPEGMTKKLWNAHLSLWWTHLRGPSFASLARNLSTTTLERLRVPSHLVVRERARALQRLVRSTESVVSARLQSHGLME